MQIPGAAIVGSSESNGEDPSTGNNDILLDRSRDADRFLHRILARPAALPQFSLGGGKDVRSKDVFILAVAAASLLVYLRTVFRLAEAAQGLFGKVSTKETFFGTWEFTPVVLAVWILAAWHPGRWLARRRDDVSPPPPPLQEGKEGGGGF